MFEKILSVLPYNPSLVHQLAFYGRRMRDEAAIRRIGLIFVVLAFFVQFFAVISPPQITTADPSNDLISGGISSKADAVNECNSPTDVADYKNILAYFGVSCADVSAATVVSLRSTDTSGGQALYSMGHIPYNFANQTKYVIDATNEYGTVYARPLHSFDTHAYSTYTALKITSSITHTTWYILYTCGNLVTYGVPRPIPKPTPPPVPKPTPAPVKTPVVCKYGTYGGASCAPCPYNNTVGVNAPSCLPCPSSTSSSDTTACVVDTKSASNLTQNIANANNTTAHPGDIIIYTLTEYNAGKGTVTSNPFSENLADVLDYANVIDLDGGTQDSLHNVIWPNVTLTAGQKISKQIRVQVMSSIPSTSPDASDTEDYNLSMTNTFGNTITINLPGTPVTTVEAASTTLVNTGPGTGLFIAAAVMVVAGYFYSRARLLATEAEIVTHETTSGGL